MTRRVWVGLVIAAVLIGTSEVSRAGRLVTPPVTYGGERAVCSVMNGTTEDIGPFTIRILRFLGTTADETTVATLGANKTALLVATSAEIGVASTVSCLVNGAGISKKTPVSLCLVDDFPAFNCLVVVQAP